MRTDRPNTHAPRSGAVFAIVSLFCIACHQEPAEEHGSGVPRSVPLASMTLEQNRSLCRFWARAVAQARGAEEDFCAYYAVMAADSVAECERAETRCIEERYHERDFADEAGCERPISLERCAPQAVAGDFEDCVSAQIERELMRGMQATCDAPDALARLPELPTACAKVEDACVGFSTYVPPAGQWISKE